MTTTLTLLHNTTDGVDRPDRSASSCAAHTTQEDTDGLWAYTHPHSHVTPAYLCVMCITTHAIITRTSTLREMPHTPTPAPKISGEFPGTVKCPLVITPAQEEVISALRDAYTFTVVARTDGSPMLTNVQRNPS